MPYLLRGHGTAARRVHADDHGFHILVLGQLVQVLHHFTAYDGMFRGEGTELLVDDFAVGIVDGNLVALVLLLRLHVDHVAQRELVDVVVIVYAQLVLDHFLDLLGIHHAVDEAGLDVVVGIGKGNDAVAGQLVQLLGRHLSAVGHVLQHLLPDALEEHGALLAVGLAHVLAGDALHRALVFSNARTLIFHANLLVESCHIHALATQSAEVYHARLVQEHRVGCRGHVIALLHVLVGKGNDPLAALLEVNECVANLLGRGGCVERGCTALYVYALDLFLVLGLADRGDDVVEAHCFHVGLPEKHRKRILAFCLLVDDPVHFQHEHGVVFYLC